MPSHLIEEDFFDELKSWSEIKLRILRDYMDAYVRIRSKGQAHVYFVDAFAGSGYYRDAGAGSPVLISQLAQHLLSRGFACQLHGIYIEADSSRFRALRESLSEFDESIATVLQGDFNDHVDDVLQRVGSAPTVFFLDPFGLKDIPFDTVRRLATRPDTELLINFNTRAIGRLAGSLDSQAREAVGKVRRLSLSIGDNPDDPLWVTEWSKRRRDDADWRKWILDHYIRNVTRGTSLRNSFAYPVSEYFGAPPKYFLIFCTRSDKAIEVMNDYLCREDENLFETYSAGPRQASFFNEVSQSDQTFRLKRLIEEVYAYGLGNQQCSREELIRHFVFTKFGEFKRKHYRDALEQLARTDRVSFGPGPKETAKLAFHEPGMDPKLTK